MVLLEGQPANRWGYCTVVPAGTYTVGFEALGGSTVLPCSRTLTVVSGQTTHVEGNYTTGTCTVARQD